MKKLGQSGFSALIVLLVIVLIGAVGGTGVLVYKKSKDTTKSTQMTSDKSPASATAKSTEATSQGQYLAIADWGVKMTIPAAFKLDTNSQVTWSYGSTNDSIEFTSDLQKSLPASCPLSTQSAGPWGITRYTEATVDPAAKDFMKHIGDYYYQRFYPQQGCEESATQITTLDNAYKQLYDSLQAE